MTQQSCPICLAPVSPSLRYPRHVCPECASDPRSADGRPLAFYNVDISGGFAGRYSDTGEIYSEHVCFIRGVRCWADEARFGGIVIQVQPTLAWESTEVDTFDALVRTAPEDAMASPTRSVVPLLDYFREPGQAVARIERLIQFNVAGIPRLTFESALQVRQGRGKSSYTDLMIQGVDGALAIEAKFTEPRYATVAEWLGPQPTSNRRAVLAGWLSLLNQFARSEVSVNMVHDLPYQLIHRMASALAPDVRHRALVYLVFGADPHSFYREDLDSIMRLIDSEDAIRAFVINVPLTPSRAFRILRERWDAGERSLGSEIRQALQSGPLFMFESPRIVYESHGPATDT